MQNQANTGREIVSDESWRDGHLYKKLLQMNLDAGLDPIAAEIIAAGFSRPLPEDPHD